MIIALVRTMARVSGKQFKLKAALTAIEVEGREASPATIPAGAVIRMISEIHVNSRLVEAVWWGHRYILIADDFIHCAVDVESGDDLGTLDPKLNLDWDS
jgi:hypothetical protein